MLELKNVSAGYTQGKEILRNVSFDIRPRQCAAIYGLNGSGKSTFLKICAGLLPLKAGSVLNTFGRPGYLQQNPRLQILGSTVREELSLSLRGLHSGTALAEAIGSWLEVFALSDISERNPRELSGGQQQRVALAAILCRKPSLLLLDEPDAFLDRRAAREFRAFVHEHCADCSVVWTHSRRSGAPKADKYFDLIDGALLTSGFPHAAH